MKKFTIKDFIEYNAPCFSCDNKINFKIAFLEQGNKEFSYLRPTVCHNHTEINLIITYSNSLFIKIDHKTNKFITNDKRALTKYLQEHKLFLSSECDRCYTMIFSKVLEFNVEKNILSAPSLSLERLMVRDDVNLYHLNSVFDCNESILTIDKIDSIKSISPTVLKLPLLPLFKFKNKIHFLDKVKTYLLFS